MKFFYCSVISYLNSWGGFISLITSASVSLLVFLPGLETLGMGETLMIVSIGTGFVTFVTINALGWWKKDDWPHFAEYETSVFAETFTLGTKELETPKHKTYDDLIDEIALNQWEKTDNEITNGNKRED